MVYFVNQLGAGVSVCPTVNSGTSVVKIPVPIFNKLWSQRLGPEANSGSPGVKAMDGSEVDSGVKA